MGWERRHELGAREVEDIGGCSIHNDWHQLYLRFRSGDIYCYRGIPVEPYEGLLAADSKGEYARSRILNRYPNQRIRTAVRTAS